MHLSVSDDDRDDDVYDDIVHFVFSPLFARVFCVAEGEYLF